MNAQTLADQIKLVSRRMKDADGKDQGMTEWVGGVVLKASWTTSDWELESYRDKKGFEERVKARIVNEVTKMVYGEALAASRELWRKMTPLIHSSCAGYHELTQLQEAFDRLQAVLSEVKSLPSCKPEEES